MRKAKTVPAATAKLPVTPVPYPCSTIERIAAAVANMLTYGGDPDDLEREAGRWGGGLVNRRTFFQIGLAAVAGGLARRATTRQLAPLAEVGKATKLSPGELEFHGFLEDFHVARGDDFGRKLAEVSETFTDPCSEGQFLIHRLDEEHLGRKRQLRSGRRA
jgi:hypothetical protein